MQVKCLADDIKGSLRAGFQITSVPQCINELVLNSLDAYSTNIAVRVNLLTFRLQVVDNGDGISNQNLALIGDRYMTSKCHTLTDYKKNTKFYGYRGETLASIRDCSKTLTISSCVKDEQTYNIIFAKESPSQIIQVQDRITPGTTVTIEDFMYNLPVRKARVNDNFDLGEIRRNLECLSLIHPKVSFSLRNDVNKKLLYSNPRAQTVEEALINLLPKVKSELLGQIKLTKDNIKISALIYKDNWVNSRARFIFANKRQISCPEVQRKFEEILNAVPIYQNKKPNFLYVLNIKCPLYCIDLCYQGGKTTATFKDFNFIVKCIGKMLKKFFEDEKISLGTNDKETCVKLTKTVNNNYRLGMMDGAFTSNGAKKKDVEHESRRKESFDLKTYDIVAPKIRSKNQKASKIEQKLKTFDVNDNIDIEVNEQKIYSNKLSSTSSLQFEDLIQNRLSENIEEFENQSDLLNQSNNSICDRSNIIGSIKNSSNHNRLFEDNLTQLDQQFFNRSSIDDFDNFTLNNEFRVKKSKFNCYNGRHKDFDLKENDYYLRKHARRFDDNNFNFNEYDYYNIEDEKIVDNNTNDVFNFNCNLNDFKSKSHFPQTNRGFNKDFVMEYDMYNPKLNVPEINNFTFCNETQRNHDNFKKYGQFERGYNEMFTLNNNREEINDFGINNCFRKSENYMKYNNFLEHKNDYRRIRCKNYVDDGFEIPQPENGFDLNVNTFGLTQPENFTVVNDDGILKPNFTNKRYENVINWQGNQSFGRTKDFPLNSNFENQCFIRPNLIENRKTYQKIVPNIHLNELGNLTVTVDEKPKQNRFLMNERRKRKREESMLRPKKNQFHDYDNITFLPNEEPQVINDVDDDFEDENRGKAIIMNKFINSHFLAEPHKFKKRKKRMSNLNFSIYTIKTRTVICDENFEFEKNELTFNVNCRFNNSKELEQNAKNFETFKFNFDKLKKLFCIPDVSTRRYDMRRTYFGKIAGANNGTKRKEKNKFKQPRLSIKKNVENSTNDKESKHINKDNNKQKFKCNLGKVRNSFRNKKQTSNLSKQDHLTKSKNVNYNDNNIEKVDQQLRNEISNSNNQNMSIFNDNIVKKVDLKIENCDVENDNKEDLKNNITKCSNKENFEDCPEFCDFITQSDTSQKKIKILSNILIKQVNTSQSKIPQISAENNIDGNGLIETEVTSDLNCSTASKFFAEIKFASSPLEPHNNRICTIFKNETVEDILNKSGKISEDIVESDKNSVFLKDNLEIVETNCKSPKISENKSSGVSEISVDLCALLTETFDEKWVTNGDVANAKKNSTEVELVGIDSINVSFLISEEIAKTGTIAKIPETEEDSDLVFTLSQNRKAVLTTKNDFHGILLSEEREDLVQKSQSNALDETWEKLGIKDNNVFYFNKKTGFSSTVNPKNPNEFHMKKRSNLLPKGFSPMSKSLHLIDELLSLTSKQNLHEEIIKSYEDELSMIKWSNLIDAKNPKEFFKSIYRERSKRLSEMEPIMTNRSNFNSMQFSKDIFANLAVLAQFDCKFIVALEKKRHLIILFDQHAVHERVRVEKLYSEYGVFDRQYKSTSLKQPLTIPMQDCDLIIIKEYISKFEALGLKFDLESDAISINRVPTCLYNKSNKKITNTSLDKLLDCLIDEELRMLKDTKNMSSIPKVIQTVINSEACRGSIMFGDKLEKDECVKLLDDLSKCNLPFQCAHGRPTLTPIIELKNIAEVPTKKVNLKNLKRN